MSDASSESHKLFVIILDQPQLIDDLLSGYLEMGIPGGTVINTRGMGQIIREEMPIFAGLASLFPEKTGARMIFSVMKESQVDSVYRLVEDVVGNLDEANSAICFTLPVDTFRGIRKT